jgi:hypothetical protein
MTYFAVDDRFHTHRKVMKLRRSECFSQAIALWTLAGSWCCAQERERQTGVVPYDVLASLGIPSWQQAMEALILAGLWDLEAGEDEAIRFHEWDHWNVPGAAERRLEEAREKGRERVRRHRERQRESAETPRSEAMERVGNVTPDVTQRLSDDSLGKGRAGQGLQVQVVETTGTSFVAENRDDVTNLCSHLADRIEANGSKRPTITKAWRTAARLLLDNDGHTEEQVHRAIDWCQDDEFWRSNVLSMPTLRKRYDQLRLKAQEQARRAALPTVAAGGTRTLPTTQRIEQDMPALMELARREGLA